MTDKDKDWKSRNVNYEKILGIQEEKIKKFVSSLDIKSGDSVLDLMCGYGAVSKEILNQSKDKNINLIMCDLYKEQIDKCFNPILDSVEKRIEDVRKMSFSSNSIDKVVIRMGLHELRKEDQQKAINEIYRIMKPKGILSLWHVLPENKEYQILFQDIVREKDKLARFNNFVEERYIFREDELLNYLKNSEFRKIELIQRADIRLDTSNRLESEFLGDYSKLENWNNYIRKRIPKKSREKLNYLDKGYSIYLNLRGMMVKAIK